MWDGSLRRKLDDAIKSWNSKSPSAVKWTE